MTRLIPWALPTIPGDSEGGYTPYPTPEPEPEPEPVVDPYDFTNAVIQDQGNSNKIYFTMSGSTRKVSGNVAGLVVNDLVGVSSVVIAITLPEYPNAVVTLNMDLVSKAVSLRSYDNLSGFSSKVLSISAYQFFVYGTAGTIIQTYEKVV